MSFSAPGDGSAMQSGWIMPLLAGEMNGPSRWMPSRCAPPRSRPVHSAATCKWRFLWPGLYTVVARKLVTPNRAQVWDIVSSACGVASSTSAPPAPWICTSINPGAKSRPPASKVRSARADEPPSSILSITFPRIRTERSGSPTAASYSRQFVIRSEVILHPST